MGIFRNHRTVLFLAFALLFSAALFNAHPWRGSAQDLPEPLLPLTPGVRERNVTNAFIGALETHHISHRELDRTLSKEAFRLYLRSLDPRKLYFYQSDIDEFKKNYELKLCELIKQRPAAVQPAFEMYNRYLTRMKERGEMVQKILDNSIDFTEDEEIVFDKRKEFTLDDKIVKEKGLQTFPKTEDEAYERWRKQIKLELLALKAEVITSEQKRKKAIEEGKEPEEVDDRDPVERLRTRYISRQRRMLMEGRIENKEILANVRTQANDDVMELFLDAIASALDPHSSYMSPSSKQSFDTMLGSNFPGIGATLTSEDGYIVIHDVVSGSPAQRAGLRKNDKILGVGQGKDGKIEEIIDFKVTDAVKLIRGPKETTVRLDILSRGKGSSRTVDIVRDTITLDDQGAKSEIFEVGQKIDGTPYKIGFIKLPNFYQDTNALKQHESVARSAASDVKKMLNKFVEANVEAVVLDMRQNTGGFLDQAIEIAGLFTGAGVVVQLKEEKSTRPRQRMNGSNTACEWTGPFVVVTDKFSASASEILSGAFKDYKRGLIVGDSTTHGKGTVQPMIDLTEPLLGGNTDLGSAKITTQGFYRPSGFSPQRAGVEADVILPSLSDVMDGVESDLDNALILQRVPEADFTPMQYVTPQIIAELKRRSAQRVKENEGFAKQMEKIVAYKESLAKKVTSLNEEQYIEEIMRFNSDEWEREELEEQSSTDRRIKRDFYVEEVLNLTVDYVNVMEESGIAFPKERTVRPTVRRSMFGAFGL
ncbi:MAG: carboxy terminal-processing peptidase [Planctomycetaceae bacterium]|jgi:carboxyl-terminal processing protease|nr:carboxy terminal-processing peptidase [Planctomycetaceae bacterium]